MWDKARRRALAAELITSNMSSHANLAEERRVSGEERVVALVEGLEEPGHRRREPGEPAVAVFIRPAEEGQETVFDHAVSAMHRSGHHAFLGVTHSSGW